MTILTLLVTILIICVAIWGVRYLLDTFGIGNPVAGVITLVVVLACLLFFLNQLGIGSGLLSTRIG